MAAPTGSTSGAAGAVGLARTDVASMFAARRTADSIAAETGSPDSPSECGRIDVERTQGIWVLTLRDDHDVSTQPSLREQLEMVAHAGARSSSTCAAPPSSTAP